jgi:hypothetical protein
MVCTVFSVTNMTQAIPRLVWPWAMSVAIWRSVCVRPPALARVVILESSRSASAAHSRAPSVRRCPWLGSVSCSLVSGPPLDPPFDEQGSSQLERHRQSAHAVSATVRRRAALPEIAVRGDELGVASRSCCQRPWASEQLALCQQVLREMIARDRELRSPSSRPERSRCGRRGRALHPRVRGHPVPDRGTRGQGPASTARRVSWVADVSRRPPARPLARILMSSKELEMKACPTPSCAWPRRPRPPGSWCRPVAAEDR